MKVFERGLSLVAANRVVRYHPNYAKVQ